VDDRVPNQFRFKQILIIGLQQNVPEVFGLDSVKLYLNGQTDAFVCPFSGAYGHDSKKGAWALD